MKKDFYGTSVSLVGPGARAGVIDGSAYGLSDKLEEELKGVLNKRDRFQIQQLVGVLKVARQNEFTKDDINKITKAVFSEEEHKA